MDHRAYPFHGPPDIVFGADVSLKDFGRIIFWDLGDGAGPHQTTDLGMLRQARKKVGPDEARGAGQ